MKQKTEICKFRKNSREEIVISICIENDIEYLNIARYYNDGYLEYYHKNPICIRLELFDDLINALQRVAQVMHNGTRLFAIKAQ